MERDGLIIVSIMLISLVGLTYSVGNITGLTTHDELIETSPSHEITQCVDSCIEQECNLEDSNCIGFCQEKCTPEKESSEWGIFNPIKKLIDRLPL